MRTEGYVRPNLEISAAVPAGINLLFTAMRQPCRNGCVYYRVSVRF
jgi:hypothetical protein